MAAAMSLDDERLGTVLEQLGGALGFGLHFVPDSMRGEGGNFAATARSVPDGRGGECKIEVLVHLLVSDPKEDGPSIWALVFYFVDRRRVAPPGMSHLTLAFDEIEGRWRAKEWENDPYDEWTDEGLED